MKDAALNERLIAAHVGMRQDHGTHPLVRHTWERGHRMFRIQNWRRLKSKDRAGDDRSSSRREQKTTWSPDVDHPDNL